MSNWIWACRSIDSFSARTKSRTFVIVSLVVVTAMRPDPSARITEDPGTAERICCTAAISVPAVEARPFSETSALALFVLSPPPDPPPDVPVLPWSRNRTAPISLKRRSWNDPGFAQGVHGVDGVAGSVRIMALRAVPDGDERDKDVANAIRYAVDNGARVVNMSFGKSHSPQKSVVDDAVRYAESKGVLLIHAAGNDGADLNQAGNFPNRDFAGGGRAASVDGAGGAIRVVGGGRCPGLAG